MINADTGVFDPRHMYGVTNQDVFRWPAIRQGTERMLLGLFITTLLMPGIPKASNVLSFSGCFWSCATFILASAADSNALSLQLLWGEEQAFYVLDSTASNYLFGRQSMSPSRAWQIHGCYRLGSAQYFQFPLEAALTGCDDEWNSLDHRDPSHPVRNIIKAMYYMREQYPALNDGFFLQQLSNKTRPVQLPGSNGVPTETGIWSTGK
jgi:alpha-1,3-glucan synthase